MKIIIFDDDPTGSQTVYGCPLLLKWDKETLIKGLKYSSPLLFLLTNTRSLSPERAEKRIREICKNLKGVMKEIGLKKEEIIYVSRGDSTLRGHAVLEPEVLNDELGPFDATFHVPAFFEGGRITINGIHFLNDLPVHKTIYAKDKIFGYSTSNLAKWLEEKSNTKIKAKNVFTISLKELDNAYNNEKGMKNLVEYLYSLLENQIITVDATSEIHLKTFIDAIKVLNSKKRFLFRSAASLINALSGISYKSNTINNFSSLRVKSDNGFIKQGIIIVGSHVRLADSQLEVLLFNQSCIGIEINANEILKIFDRENYKNDIVDFENKILKDIFNALSASKTPVLYTTRGEILFSSNSKRMQFGIFLAQIIARIVCKCLDRISYIISKGGITTNVLLSEGLNLSLVNLKGQILPGLSIVCPEENNIGLPIITFPGNLGDENSLLEAWKIMENI